MGKWDISDCLMTGSDILTHYQCGKDGHTDETAIIISHHTWLSYAEAQQQLTSNCFASTTVMSVALHITTRHTWDVEGWMTAWRSRMSWLRRDCASRSHSATTSSSVMLRRSNLSNIVLHNQKQTSSLLTYIHLPGFNLDDYKFRFFPGFKNLSLFPIM